MARIRIEDIEPIEELSDDELGEVVGGFSLYGGGSTMYDAWTPTDGSMLQDPMLSSTMYDAWVPG